MIQCIIKLRNITQAALTLDLFSNNCYIMLMYMAKVVSQVTADVRLTCIIILSIQYITGDDFVRSNASNSVSGLSLWNSSV
jgi:hypothetical protein